MSQPLELTQGHLDAIKHCATEETITHSEGSWASVASDSITVTRLPGKIMDDLVNGGFLERIPNKPAVQGPPGGDIQIDYQLTAKATGLFLL